MTYTNSELIEIEVLHVKWLNDEKGGVRADFSGQDLSNYDFSNMNFIDAIFSIDNFINANFHDADLRNVDFSRKGE